jgi:hypothetical protein
MIIGQRSQAIPGAVIVKDSNELTKTPKHPKTPHLPKNPLATQRGPVEINHQ